LVSWGKVCYPISERAGDPNLRVFNCALLGK